MEHNDEGLEDDFPLQRDDFQAPFWFPRMSWNLTKNALTLGPLHQALQHSTDRRREFHQLEKNALHNTSISMNYTCMSMHMYIIYIYAKKCSVYFSNLCIHFTTIKQTNKKLSHLLLTDHKSGTHPVEVGSWSTIIYKVYIQGLQWYFCWFYPLPPAENFGTTPFGTSVNVSGLTCPFPSWSKWRKAQRTMSSEKRRGTPRWITRDSPRCESPLNRRFNRGFLVEEKRMATKLTRQSHWNCGCCENW